ncbi:hypothetical protein [Paenibacillus sp. MMO-58]
MQAAINRKRWPAIAGGCRHTVGLKSDGMATAEAETDNRLESEEDLKCM